MQVNADHVITRALNLLGVYGPGESINGDEMTSALASLNEMLDSWRTERLFVYTTQENVSTLTAGTQTRTIGPGGQINVTERPEWIDDWSFVRDTTNNPSTPVDYRMTRLNDEQYSSLTVKSITSTYPTNYYFDGAYPLATIYFYPVPTLTTQLHLRLPQLMTAFADLSTNYDMPPGYQRAVIYSFAEELAPVYGRPVLPNVEDIAAKARRNIKRVNKDDNVMQMPVQMMRRSGQFNIYTGE